MTTGPKHWELLLRARAVDNQVPPFPNISEYKDINV
jgi:hypothetical protein